MAKGKGFWARTNRRTITFQKNRIQILAAEHPIAFWALWGTGRVGKFLCWTAPVSLVRWGRARLADRDQDTSVTVTPIGAARRATERV